MISSLACYFALAAFSAAGAAAEQHAVWIEAEQFAEPGGWTNDAQFIDQMGSPYLMAIGLGTPVDDAVTTVAVAKAGRYRLWARTKDWIPEHHPGRFQILVDGKPSATVFGANGKTGWHWEDGGVFVLTGNVEIRLHDLTGYYGRCDAVLLTPDVDWRPTAGQTADLRQRLGGVSRQIQDRGPYDVVVVGGGLAGCTAAVAAARGGAKTALIQNRPVLGGNASTEILVPPVGVWPHRNSDPLDPRETGLVEEYRTEGNQKVVEGVLYSARLMRFVRQEPNLDLLLNTHATGVEMRDSASDAVQPRDAIQPSRAIQTSRAIQSVLVVDTRTGQRLRFRGDIFIDCTGDAVVGVAAGAEYRHGKEPRAMYNEPWAPAEASPHTMGNSLKYASKVENEPQPFTAPPWAYRFESCDDFSPGRHPVLGGPIGWQWKIELGGTRDTYADAEEIRDDLLRLIYGMWDHTKNHCAKQEQVAAVHRLAWVAHVAGKRENRRLLGDYVLNENDIREQTQFPDCVAYGGWTLDDHYSEGFFHKGSFGIHQDMPGGLDPCKGKLFGIPLRCLYSKNVDNLLMAGRNISASHMALSNTRVMLTCAVIGQAAGTTAAMCIRHDTSPRGIYLRHPVPLQQQLLKDGAYLMGWPNDDRRDLAKRAKVTASSELTRDDGQRLRAANATNGYARAEAGQTNAWSPAADVPGPHWLQLQWDQPVEFNVVHVTFATRRHAPATFRVEAWQDENWRCIGSQTEIRHRRYVLGLEPLTSDRLRIAMDGSCLVSEVRIYHEPQAVVESARRALATMTTPDDPPDYPWLYDVDPRKLPGIVIDASQAIRTGRWVPSTFAQPYVLDGYVHDGDEGKGEKSIRFTPEIPATGRYEIRFSYVAYGNRAKKTPVIIETPAGKTTVHVDQTRAPEIEGLFHSLGQYNLPAGRDTQITITNENTTGYVVVDALQVVPVEGTE